MRALIWLIVLYTGLFPLHLQGQQDSVSPSYKTRRGLLISSTGVLAGGSLLALHQVWYKDYNTGRFHFFNDNQEWLQMDKAGHVYSCYQMSRLMMEAFDWAGYSGKKKLFIGGSIGLVYMTAIECMDGFSEGWGFSWGDQLANVLGSGLAIAQVAAWEKPRLHLKFSYAESGLAPYHPSLLGENPYSRILKDYNAQTYWLSFNPLTLAGRQSRFFPNWLNLSFGYSAYGMLGGHYNAITVQDAQGNVLKFDRQRRFYLSLDLDLTRIPVRSKFLKGLFSVVNMLKIPAPALELSSSGLRWQALYY